MAEVARRGLDEGVPIFEVSRWLGRESTTAAVDWYGHLVPEATGRARDVLGKAFSRATADVPEMCRLPYVASPQLSAIWG